MHEPLAESGLGLTLMPAAQQRRLHMSDSHNQPTSLSELQRFMHLVACDGRFLAEVVNDPGGVAKKLGTDLSPDVQAQFREKSLDQHLAELWLIKYPAKQMEAVSDYVINVVIVVVVAIAAIVLIDGIVALVGQRPKRPIDRSPHAHLKL
jgi:hypothetical protein